ncbi:hypothetical protein [Neobacillus dielmonensis]|uniref:hypothetical protein n=1 Tax=Neobacillus dielmonensis TaxID=1347369 RepID=UPI0005A798E8|nr:hypothetical protein [Neobacillus dielmonensis]
MFKILVLFYFLVCIGYAVVGIRRKKENILIKSLLITFFPFLGFLLVVYLFKPIKSDNSQPRSTHDGNDEPITVIEGEISLYKTIDVESEINFVPIQEALLLNDNSIKRKLMIHSLKENSIGNPIVLEKALKCDDSETSHYAATAIMEMKRKLMNSIQELASVLEERPNDPEVLISYAEVIKTYINSGFLDEGTYKQYQSLQSSVLERILLSEQSQKQHYIDKIDCDLNLRAYDKAAYFCEKFLAEYPNDEMAYITAMKLQYKLSNSQKLQDILTTLKKQPVKLSAQGLSLIRFWL